MVEENDHNKQNTDKTPAKVLSFRLPQIPIVPGGGEPPDAESMVPFLRVICKLLVMIGRQGMTSAREYAQLTESIVKSFEQAPTAPHSFTFNTQVGTFESLEAFNQHTVPKRDRYCAVP